jgi:hypothetical protein
VQARREAPFEVESHPIAVELEFGRRQSPKGRIDSMEFKVSYPDDPLLRSRREGCDEDAIVGALGHQGRSGHDSATARGRRSGAPSRPLTQLLKPSAVFDGTEVASEHAGPQTADAPFGAPALLFETFE